MYKKQLKIQKFICLLCVITAALTFLYALGMITDINEVRSSLIKDLNKPTMTRVEGIWIYLDMQPFNKEFVSAAIVPILLACLLYITNTHTRRKYYITNYLAVGAYSFATIRLVVWAHAQIEAFAVQYMTTINFEQWKVYCKAMKENPNIKADIPYLDNTNMLDLHQVVFAIAIASVVLLIACTIWKIILMRGEKKLLAAGEEAAV